MGKEVLGQRLKRVAPCLKKTLKILDLVLRKLAQTQPLKLSLTRNAKQLRMKLLSNLILSNARIRILLMKSKISLTNLEKEDAPFMILISSAVDWKQKRRSFKLHWKKQRPP